ncbi:MULTISPECIES: alpha,alpha-trehalose-phosphate synthase (UDP-forming) [unclassified Sphingobium]|uniref:alpha,alpha-trehalose-phosphate synthase (UDP-forming) n=1 Tax=unclassified Sphingobium TaxID=2611147 RepID=UPI0022256E60|nr:MULTISPECIES: trehalose-6-phosphate synthase [unclassified Sphingobium]MCW2380885.1 trehalose 6-phosphate synthase [Sphingobium sp. B2D3B]MCW2399008.1 trehalose 6-phosphate synthase [Sphingobium sp. B2D3C]
MTRLVIVSNRVSPPTGEGQANQGGLAVALSSALRETNGIWFGWSGNETETFTGHVNFSKSDGVTTATVDLEPQDIDEYYNGFANRTLWPLFHDRTDLAEFERNFAGGYARVNERFADTLLPLITPEDLIWVHDYHLIPLGAELRKRDVTNRTGFFLHTPWPVARLLTSLPSHAKLVNALFAYDLLGFQCQAWLDSFLYYVHDQFPEAEISDGVIRIGDRTVRVVACPIGIDAGDFAKSATTPEADEARESILRSLEGRDLIMGVDRLDYSKGMEQRFHGYSRLLQDHPEFQEKVTFLQIAPPSREQVASYQDIRRELDALSGHINGEFATAHWVPLRYVNRGYDRLALSGMYRSARAALVTPLRDGMNLVAKEYVAAQDPENPGVLILSRYAGAAEQLQDALLVNPFSPEELADALHQALLMPLEERKTRWRAMMDSVETQDIRWWLKRFLDLLTSEHPPRESAAEVSESSEGTDTKEAAQAAASS